MTQDALENTFSIQLTPDQLWYLTKLLGPGLIFGVDNLAEDVSEEETAELETEAVNSLRELGLIAFPGGNQVQVDDFLGAMIISCIHSKDLMMVKNPATDDIRYYHFLPQWQLEFRHVDEGYALTVFKDRTDLFQHILSVHEMDVACEAKDFRFSVGARDLEMAAFLFETGKQNDASKILQSGYGKYPNVTSFLKGYLQPDGHLIFDMLFARDDENLAHSVRNEIMNTGEGLYWMSHDEAGEEAVEMVHFRAISGEQANYRFNLMLPADEIESQPE